MSAKVTFFPRESWVLRSPSTRRMTMTWHGSAPILRGRPEYLVGPLYVGAFECVTTRVWELRTFIVEGGDYFVAYPQTGGFYPGFILRHLTEDSCEPK